MRDYGYLAMLEEELLNLSFLTQSLPSRGRYRKKAQAIGQATHAVPLTSKINNDSIGC